MFSKTTKSVSGIVFDQKIIAIEQTSLEEVHQTGITVHLPTLLCYFSTQHTPFFYFNLPKLARLFRNETYQL